MVLGKKSSIKLYTHSKALKSLQQHWQWHTEVCYYGNQRQHHNFQV